MTMDMNKLIILDRDGVVNVESNQYIRNPDEWYAIPNSLVALRKLTEAGFTISIATNQSGVGRGYFSKADLAAIHDKMLAMVHQHGGKIDSIFYCSHLAAENCRCRKPNIGMIEQIAEHYNYPNAILPASVCFVGDSACDLQAAHAANITPVLVMTGNGHKTYASHPELATHRFADLLDFVDNFLLK